MASIGRFQVMAVLQAARAMHLGLRQDEAKSWGLNRAIFYAAARRGFKGGHARGGARSHPGANEAELEELRKMHETFYVLGGEKAYRARTRQGLRFKIGGKIQSPEDFDRQIKKRFPDWNEAWTEAREIIESVEPRTLQSQSSFYKNVYKPRRDELSEHWSASPKAEKSRRKVVSLERRRAAA